MFLLWVRIVMLLTIRFLAESPARTWSNWHVLLSLVFDLERMIHVLLLRCHISCLVGYRHTMMLHYRTVCRVLHSSIMFLAWSYSQKEGSHAAMPCFNFPKGNVVLVEHGNYKMKEWCYAMPLGACDGRRRVLLSMLNVTMFHIWSFC